MPSEPNRIERSDLADGPEKQKESEKVQGKKGGKREGGVEIIVRMPTFIGLGMTFNFDSQTHKSGPTMAKDGLKPHQRDSINRD